MSGFYIGVDGVARKVKDAYIGVDGVARKIKKGYIGDANGIARVVYSSGKKLSSCAVGTIVQLPENGTNVEYIVVHQGLPSSMYDESCNGTWLLRKNIYSKKAWDASPSNVYQTSDINKYLNNEFYNVLDEQARNAIKEVKIPYVNSTGVKNTVASGENGLTTKVFLLSGYEVGFTTSVEQYFPVDGAKLDYFEDGDGTNALNKRIALFNGTATNWWLRSPRTYDDEGSWAVMLNGNRITNTCNGSYGVRPALILKSNTLLDPETNIIL